MKGFLGRLSVFSILFQADIPLDIENKLVKSADAAPQAVTIAAPSGSRLKEVEWPVAGAVGRAVQILGLLQPICLVLPIGISDLCICILIPAAFPFAFETSCTLPEAGNV